MSRDPQDWTDAEWAAHDDAWIRLMRRCTDQCARDLDLLGWKIVRKDGDPQRWPTSWLTRNDGPFPSWAESFPVKLSLRVIDGGKR